MNDIYTLVLDLTFILPLIWIVLVIAISAAQQLWGFIDDEESAPNLAVKFIMVNVYKYRLSGSGYNYNKYIKENDESDGCLGLFSVLGILAITPSVILVAIHFYAIFLVLCVSVGVVFLARFTRRINKKLSKHCEDNKTHKVE